MTQDDPRLLERGTLRIHVDGQPSGDQPFAMRLLGPEHFAAVVGVQEALTAALQNPSLYYPNPPELLRLCLGEQGLTIGTFVANRLIGFRSILYPGAREDNLGRDIGLSANDLNLVAHLERTVVLPDYRGNRLQMRMTAHAIRLGIATRDVRQHGGQIQDRHVDRANQGKIPALHPSSLLPGSAHAIGHRAQHQSRCGPGGFSHPTPARRGTGMGRSWAERTRSADQGPVRPAYPPAQLAAHARSSLAGSRAIGQSQLV